VKSKFLLFLALVLGNHLVAVPLATNNPSSSRVHNWEYIQYPWTPNCPVFCIGWPSASFQRSLEMSQGLRLDILCMPQGPAFFTTNTITASLYRANGEVVEPTPEGKSLLNSPGYLQTFSSSHGMPAPQVMTFFPWGLNILEECWIEVTIPPERYWVEVPYGFDRNPADALAPANTNGPPGFFPMKSLTEHDHVVRWQNVHYDLGEVQKGWGMSLVQSNLVDASSEVVLYFEGGKNDAATSWYTNPPVIGLCLLDASGTAIGTRCVDVHIQKILN
jgi:hypothetical protein